jgi:hypothetical protein
MGKAVGAIIPKRRAEMYIKLIEENEKNIITYIEEAPKKVCIFSSSVAVVKKLEQVLSRHEIGHVTITGENAKDRPMLLAKFREDDSIDVILGTNKILETGVTLVEANIMMIFGTPWRNSDFNQLCDRIHRIGQTDDCYIYTFYLESQEKNLSNRMDEILEWSKNMTDSYIDTLVENSENSTESSLVMKYYNIEDKDRVSFEDCYSCLNEVTNIAERRIMSVDNNVYSVNYYLATEGFKETITNFGRKLLRTIIAVIKAIIEWVKNVILIIGRFIRDKIIYKLFGRERSQTEIKNISIAYDKYCNLPIGTSGTLKSTESDNINGEDTKISEGIGTILPLSEELKRDLRYMNFQKDNFDIINRVSAITTNAVMGVKKCLELNKRTENILRIYGIRYGDKEEEGIYTAYKNDKNYHEHTYPLFFYHERSFLEFIYFIDKLTKGNLDKLITERRYYLDNEVNGNTIENRINLNISGEDVADAIILNCSLDELDTIKRKAERIDPENIKISDIMSKDVFMKIISGNNNILDKLNKEANNTLGINNKLAESLDVFYKHLTAIDKKLSEENIDKIKGFASVDEVKIWIQFLVSFTNRFMRYRLNMISIIKRIMNILAFKTREESVSVFISKKRRSRNSSLGRINIYSNEEFSRLYYNKLVDDGREICLRQARNMLYDNKLPIYVIPIADSIAMAVNIFEGRIGFSETVTSGQKEYFDKIGYELATRKNENKLIQLYYNMHNSKSTNILIGAVIFINVNKCETDMLELGERNTKYKNFFPYCLNYYSVIVHETIHAVRYFMEMQNMKDSRDNINDRNSPLGNEIFGRKNKKERDDLFVQSYLSQNHEVEAHREQFRFLLSTIENSMKEEKIYIESELQKKFGLVNVNSRNI